MYTCVEISSSIRIQYSPDVHNTNIFAKGYFLGARANFCRCESTIASIFHELPLSRMHTWEYREVKYSVHCLTHFTICAKCGAQKGTRVRQEFARETRNLLIINKPHAPQTEYRTTHSTDRMADAPILSSEKLLISQIYGRQDSRKKLITFFRHYIASPAR